jgi:hypothetical protein
MNRLIALGIMDGEIQTPIKESFIRLPSSIKDILESEGVEKAYEALNDLDDKYKKTIMLCLADVAESVFHIYEEKYPGDFRVRNCIQGIRDFCNDKITREDLEKLRDAASAAPWAVATAATTAASATAASAYWASTSVVSADDQWRKNEEILRKYL